MNRRRFVMSAAAAPAAAVIGSGCSTAEKPEPAFRFCLNTSTINGGEIGLLKSMEIAAQAGYDGVEIWVRDLKACLDSGHSLSEIEQRIKDHGLAVESAIGFAPWLTGKAGFDQMRDDMQLLSAVGCRRIAAPPAGVPSDAPLDLFKAGEAYAELLELGRETGVMPQLEFWGASQVLWHLGQALMIAAAANDPDARILPDVYHLFRGGSGFNGLKMLSGQLIDIFHMNDYPDKAREEQNDADRVYPGDGVAPVVQILTDLNAGGPTVLSLELFNREYWKHDPLTVAETGLRKMRTAVSGIK
ncbi:MAG: sugar phosphate isomerase/epimerase family protein [candidate division KSB1 bacterium]|nr:sugar phosphate isomerase/epimerase family protein [candidate division KSB1 bacterium]